MEHMVRKKRGKKSNCYEIRSQAFEEKEFLCKNVDKVLTYDENFENLIRVILVTKTVDQNTGRS